jgi:S1-C subfamily serine protease
VRLPEKAGEELRLAGLLIDAAAGTVDWSAYRDQAAQELKALIEASVEEGSPAALAGIKPQDVIQKANGEKAEAMPLLRKVSIKDLVKGR